MKVMTIILSTMAVLIALSLPSWAASKRCVVIESEENRLVLECKGETEDFIEGMEVKIKTVKKAAIEGC